MISRQVFCLTWNIHYDYDIFRSLSLDYYDFSFQSWKHIIILHFVEYDIFFIISLFVITVFWYLWWNTYFDILPKLYLSLKAIVFVHQWRLKNPMNTQLNSTKTFQVKKTRNETILFVSSHYFGGVLNQKS